ncbi:hypothetical protein Hanom_Chr08g00731351 [Helianthus anomalus]
MNKLSQTLFKKKKLLTYWLFTPHKLIQTLFIKLLSQKSFSQKPFSQKSFLIFNCKLSQTCAKQPNTISLYTLSLYATTEPPTTITFPILTPFSLSTKYTTLPRLLPYTNNHHSPHEPPS